MERGLYIAGTGMLLQRRKMETITNNLVNVETSGYKKEHLVSHSFDEVLIRRINDPHVLSQRKVYGLHDPRDNPGEDDTYISGRKIYRNTPRVGTLHLGTQIDQLYINYEMGKIDGTERTTDFALVGDAFFVVQTEAGERYTRAGAYYVDELGYLTDGEGHFLLGDNGPIQVGGLNFKVNELGQVSVGDEYIDRIRVASFADNGQLRRQGSNLYYSLEEPLAEENPHRIMQGFLEMSNVEIEREMVDMITVYRTYESNQRMLTMIDEITGKAVNEIGRLR